MNQPKRKHNPHPQRAERPKPRMFKGPNQTIKMFAFEAQERGLSYGKYVAAIENPVTVEPAPVKYKTANQRARIAARRERRKQLEQAKTGNA